MVNIKNFKKWIIPILIFIFYKILYSKMIFHFKIYGSDNFPKLLFIGNLVSIIILILLIKFIFKDKFNSIDSAKKVSLKKSIFISVVTFLFTILIMREIVWIEYFVFGPLNVISNNTASQAIAFKVNPWPIVGLSLVTSTIEEIVYRRILFGYLYDLHSGCNKYVRVITSVLVSSIIFGAIHDGVFHPGMMEYVAHGIIFSGIYLYTKRISSAITVHILYNVFLDIIRIL